MSPTTATARHWRFRSTPIIALAALVLAGGGCGDDASQPADAGAPDRSTPETGAAPDRGAGDQQAGGDVGAPQDQGATFTPPGKVGLARGLGGKLEDEGWDVAVDGKGGLILVGAYRGAIKVGSTSLTSAGGTDILVVGLDAQGKVGWAASLGGVENDGGHGVAVDAKGNVFVVGTVGGKATFGTKTLASAGAADAFVARLDAQGKVGWVTSIGGAQADDGRGVAVDTKGGVVVTGGFHTKTTQGPLLSSKGGDDIFVVRLDAQGKSLWARSFGGSGSDYGWSAASDGKGGALVTGNFDKSITIGGKQHTSQGSWDGFALRLDGKGAVVWSAAYGGASSDFGRGICTDGKEGAFVTGAFQGSAIFDSKNVLSSTGGSDLFAARINKHGVVVWAKGFGGAGADQGLALAADGAGGAFLTGSFQQAVTVGVSSLSAVGKSDILVLHIGELGAAWAKGLGGTGWDTGRGVATRGKAVYIAGSFESTLNLGGGSTSLTSGGQTDALLLGLEP
jgi:hypothetical protein